jgi:hypothetical protein
MSTPLVVCEGCSRHVRACDAACPFCQAAIAPVTPVAVADEASARGHSTGKVVLTVAAGMSLAACYGGPPRPRTYSPGESSVAATVAPDDLKP